MINSWSVSLYASYMVLTYLAFAGFSAALLKPGMLRGWLITCSSIFGVIVPFLFASGVFVFGMPITAQLVPFLLGVKILANRNSLKNRPLQEG
ncbi:hypothetical protein QQ054_29415 [Oscillatoria amoena NRMC-F 0135]|nr:hypothetical protein [Oscillatoria amoena NRMC-F 0135]